MKISKNFGFWMCSILAFFVETQATFGATYIVNPGCTSAPPTCFQTIESAISAAESDFLAMLHSNLEILIYPNRNALGQIIPYNPVGGGIQVKVPMKIRGVEGVSRTLIDLQNNKRAFALTSSQNYPGLEYSITGLQIRNGFVNLNSVYSNTAGPLGSIFCQPAGPNSLGANRAVGGAIVVDAPETVKIKHNWFLNNEANPYQGLGQPVAASFGGAIGINHFQDGGIVEIDDNYFEGNISGNGVPARGGVGGAIHAFLVSPNSNLVIRRNHFFDNFASGAGGAISVVASDRTRNNCSSTQNYVGIGSVRIESNIIRNNRMVQDSSNPSAQGAGISAFWIQNLDVRNNVIAGNTISTANAGAAIFMHQLAGNIANLDHNTFFNNTANPGNPLANQGVIGSARGSGQTFLPGADSQGTIFIRNSILRRLNVGAQAVSNSCGFGVCNFVHISNSNIEWGAQPLGSTPGAPHVGVSSESSVQDSAEIFVSEATQDLHLKPGSAGQNLGAALATVSVDLDNNPRTAIAQLNPGAPDSGAYEYYGSGSTYLLRSDFFPLKGGQISNASDLVLRTLGGGGTLAIHLVNLSLGADPAPVSIGGVNGNLLLGNDFVVLPGLTVVDPIFGVGNYPIDLNSIQLPDRTPVDLIFQSFAIDPNPGSQPFNFTPALNRVRVNAN